MKSHFTTLTALIGMLAAGSAALAQTPLGSGLTYQGQLQMGGSPLNDTADFQFTLWDADVDGNMIGSVVAVNNVSIVDGPFTVELDFGSSVFNGDARWLEIDVASPSGGEFTTLSPRQPLTAAPYALKVPGIDGHSLDSADGSSTDVVFVDNDGNVGIGTTDPSEALEVVGTVAATAFVGDGSGLSGLVGSTVDLDNVALLRWDLLNSSFPVGDTPQGVAFDGANIWVVNGGSNSVTRLSLVK